MIIIALLRRDCKAIFDGRKEFEMEHDFYQMYLEELKGIAPLGSEEKEAILSLAAQGDEAARKRLVEGNLTRMTEIAGEYKERKLPMADVIQEANTALMLAAVEYDGSGDWDSLLEEKVREAISLALSEQERELEIEENMAARVNVLQTVSAVMAKELGREATLEELSERMKMSQDEIKDLMKLALDALTVSGEGAVAKETDRE